MEFGIPLRLVGLINLILIVSWWIYYTKERTLLKWFHKGDGGGGGGGGGINTGLCFNIYRLLSVKLGMCMDITEHFYTYFYSKSLRHHFLAFLKICIL